MYLMDEFKFIDIPLYMKNDSVQRQVSSLYQNNTFHDIFIKIIIFTISITVRLFNFYQKRCQVIHYAIIVIKY